MSGGADCHQSCPCLPLRTKGACSRFVVTSRALTLSLVLCLNQQSFVLLQQALDHAQLGQGARVLALRGALQQEHTGLQEEGIRTDSNAANATLGEQRPPIWASTSQRRSFQDGML